MSKKTSPYDLDKPLIDAIINPRKDTRKDIISILKKAKGELKAADVRFRPRDWEDQSVVYYVPEWIMGGKLKEPELARRVYYDPNKPKRMDCMVGLVARIARVEEEETKEEKDKNLIQEMLRLVKDKANKNRQKFRFNCDEVNKIHVFQSLIQELRKKAKDWKKKAESWNKYYTGVSKLKLKGKSFMEKAFSSPPWKKEKKLKRRKNNGES